MNGVPRNPAGNFGFRVPLEGGILILDIEAGRLIIMRHGNPQ
jgi:hypothetical protein